MQNLFKGTALGSWLVVVVIFLGIRLPLEIMGIPELQTEIKWLSIGEYLNTGKWPYIDLWDNTSLFSMLTYGALFFLFGKTTLVYHILASVLLFMQAVVWNNILIKNKVYTERSVLPAFLYILLGHLFIDTWTLSPPLLALSFLLLAFDYTLQHINENITRSKVFEIGFFLGISALFYMPILALVPAIVLGFAFFSTTDAKKYFLFLFGLLLPFVPVLIGYMFSNHLNDFYRIGIVPLGFFSSTLSINLLTLFILIALPTLLVGFGFILLLQSSRFINYQIRVQQFFFLIHLFSLITLLLSTEISIYHFFISLPLSVFFITYFFTLLPNWLLRNSILVIFLICCVGLNYVINLRVLPAKASKYLPYPESIFLKEQPLHFSSKKIWIVGYDFSLYKQNSLTTPYLNVKLLKENHRDLANYQTLVEVFENLSKSPPEIIIDQLRVLPEYWKYLPTIALKYKQEGNVYYLKE